MESLFRFKTANAQWLMGHGIVWILILIHRLVIGMENASMDGGMDTVVQGGSFDWYKACCNTADVLISYSNLFLLVGRQVYRGGFPLFHSRLASAAPCTFFVL